MKNCRLLIINPYYILFFLCCFPFIGPNIGTDCQPFALLTALFLLVYQKRVGIRNRQVFYNLIIFAILLMTVSILYIELFDVVKRMFSYISILVIPIVVYNSNIDVYSKKFEKHIKFYMIIWFCVGLIQMLWDRNFMHFLVPLMRTTGNRGVCSLASEPSFYGYMCFFFFLISLDFKKRKWFYVVLQILQLVLLAQSTVAILYFGIYMFFNVMFMFFKLSRKNVYRILLIAIFGLIGAALVLHFYSDTRMGYLLREILQNPFRLVSTDGSVMERFESLRSSFSRWGIPYFAGSTVIMSGYGGAFYELGIAAIVLYVYIWKMIAVGYDDIRKIVNPLVITICMFSAIQLSLPMFAFFLGYCVLRAKGQKEFYKNNLNIAVKNMKL